MSVIVTTKLVEPTNRHLVSLNFHHGVPVEQGGAASVFSLFVPTIRIRGVLLARLLLSGVVQHEEDKPRYCRFLLVCQTTTPMPAVQISAMKSKSIRF